MIRRTVVPPGFRVELSPVLSRADIQKLLGATNAKLIQVAQQTGANVIDPIQSLCDHLTCPAVSPDGEPIYVDGAHIRPSYARANVSYLDETVLDANLAPAIIELQNR
jgi:hypothetical protein